MTPKTKKRSPALSAPKCRAKAQRCLKKGGFRYGKAPDVVRELMAERGLSDNDLLNVIKAKTSKVSHEWDENFEEWRYTIKTERIKVLVSFESPERLVFITFWRLKKR